MKTDTLVALSEYELAILYEVLHYLKMEELRAICEFYTLATNGKKFDLIRRITTFIQGDEVVEAPAIPMISKAQKGRLYPIEPDAYMVCGAYKNDAKTRAFFKKIVGEHFHFTAYGLDWLNERWHSGNPPTYRQFAQFWQQEHEARKQRTAQPKKEWAYINFTQRYLKQFPDASRAMIAAAWKQEREKHVREVEKILKIVLV